MATWEERLATKKAIYEATTQAILRLHSPAAPQRATYAEATRAGTNTTQQGVNVANPKDTNIHATATPNTEPMHTAPPTLPHIAITATNQSNEGWTVVTRKRKKVPPATRKPYQHKSLHPELKKHQATLLAEGRCFRCLQSGHKHQQCLAARKCLKCHATTHIAKFCPAFKAHSPHSTPANPPPFPIKRPTPHKHTTTNKPPQRHTNTNNNTNTTHTHNNNSRAPPSNSTATKPKMANWQDTPMLDPGLVNHLRPQEQRTYIQPREGLHPTNAYLYKSAIVLAGPYFADRFLPQRLKSTMARHFRCSPRDFRIANIAQKFGDLLIEFPTQAMKNEAVRVGVFNIGANADVQLVPWTPGIGLNYDPTSHRARLRLHGLPLHNWNHDNIEDLLAGVGYLIAIAPFETSTDLQSIRVLIACHHPTHIPNTLLAGVEPYTTQVVVELEGWTQGAPNDPPNMPQGGHPENPANEDGNDNNNDRNNASGSDAWQSDSDSSYSPPSGGSGDYFRRRTRNVAISPLTESPVLELLENHTCHLGLEQQSALVPYKQPNFTSPIRAAQELSSPISARNSTESGLQQHRSPFPANNPATQETSLHQQHRSPIPANNSAAQEIGLDGHSEPQGFTGLPKPNTQTNHTTPPGFEGPPQYKKHQQPQAARRSPRLKEKHNGLYIPSLHKAQMVMGYADNEKRTSTPRKRSRKNATPLPTYLQSNQPITGEQAEVVLLLAGIEMEQELAVAIAQVVQEGTKDTVPNQAPVQVTSEPGNDLILVAQPAIHAPDQPTGDLQQFGH
ncbi:hypothetical protein FCM35_KLT17178 [Carex littledalei]|uniref:CCHC-type domain-containing protein n=1 Tax=Carex littledalei TaxID=544730 RepID=A0A833RFR4_9POAL|nr:hypothetical protein FCM35_KLT17178 [Carex littledalei]